MLSVRIRGEIKDHRPSTRRIGSTEHSDLDDVPGSSLSLGANHRSTFANTAQRFSERSRAADKWNPEVMLHYVVLYSFFVRRELLGQGTPFSRMLTASSAGVNTSDSSM